MNRPIRWLAELVTLLPLLLVTGCVSGRAGIAVVNLETGQTVVKPCQRGRIEYIIGTDESSGTFFTLQKAIGSRLHFRRINYMGETVTEQTIPLFNKGYCSTSYALSPDATRIAYVDESTKALLTLDLKTLRSDVLMPEVTSSVVYLEFIRWLSITQLVVAVFNPDKNTNDKILVINTASRKVEQKFEPRDILNFHGCLSPSKRYLAFRSRNKKYGRVEEMQIYDLQSRTKIATIPGPADGHINFPKWSSDEKCLAYVAHYLKREKLIIYSITEAKSDVLKEVSEKKWLSISWFGTNRLYYSVQERDSRLPYQPLRVLNLENRSETKITLPPSTGQSMVLENGTRLIRLVGY